MVLKRPLEAPLQSPVFEKSTLKKTANKKFAFRNFKLQVRKPSEIGMKEKFPAFPHIPVIAGFWMA